MENKSLENEKGTNDNQCGLSSDEIREICEKTVDKLMVDGWRLIEWINVKKELPDNDGECLAVIADENGCAWYGFCHFDKTDKIFTLSGTNRYLIEPTHWMYLPEPPSITVADEGV